MNRGNPNAQWLIDPTAGVRLAPRVVHCPRCGIAKGQLGQVRKTLCVDCRDELTPAERAAWRGAA